MAPDRIRQHFGTAPRILVMILAGGEGRRLAPLTEERAKPAVPFGGRYRIIDIVLSNFVNSGLNRINVITQYKSHSLEVHISRAWRMSSIMDQFVETIPAQQRVGKDWFKGSADAVFQCLNVVTDEEPDFVCVFGGDHVYQLDVRQMLDYHFLRGAELTVALIPVPLKDASAFGVVQVDQDWRIVGFQEKPENPEPMPGRPDHALVSMGNYIFNTATLVEEVTADAALTESSHDFGKNVLPAMVGRRRMYGYDFSTNVVPGSTAHGRGYWRDIGTLDAYWEAHMDLVSAEPLFDFYNLHWPIRTGRRHLPPAKFVHGDEQGERVGTAIDSLVAEGCIVSGGRISRSVLSPLVRVNSWGRVEESILLDGVDVGRGAQLRRVIVDKNVRIPPGLRIGFDLEADRQRFLVSDGGVVAIRRDTKL
ncbi:MAG: glucose-1-phosphate adenylyltransferase [Deltaproteobacteria bacterium]|nr:glucose-1-phosphate adenylyltransferase [Deltaproteobacteria bacterium]